MNFDKNPSSSENGGATAKKEVCQRSKIPRKISHPSRNPLSSLSENIPLPQKSVPVSTAQNCSKKENAIKKKIRSKSTGGETQAKRIWQIHEDPREVLCSRTGSEAANCNEQSNQLEKKRSFVVPELVPKPPKKKSSYSFLFEIQEVFANECLYNEEYFSENNKYMIETEKKLLVYSKTLLTNHINYKYRMEAIILLFQLEHSFKSSGTTLFTALRMFDHFLIKVRISTNEYELIGITCFWIASKFENSQSIMVSELTNACAKYSKFEIIAMEKLILKTLKFKVKFPEQSTFLYYLLRNVQLERDCKILLGAMFLLDLFTYLIEFALYSSTQMVAVAVYLTLMQYNMNCDGLLQYIYSHVVREVIFNRLAKKMNDKVKQIIKSKSVSSKIIAKYSKDDELSVVQYFTID